MKNKTFNLVLICFIWIVAAQAQDMEKRWDKNISRSEHPHIQWFKHAKFGMFIHWGLYSELGGVWKNRNYCYVNIKLTDKVFLA